MIKFLAKEIGRAALAITILWLVYLLIGQIVNLVFSI